MNLRAISAWMSRHPHYLDNNFALDKTEKICMNAFRASLENLAGRIAAAKGGRITPNDLAPWLPVSLELIIEYLDEMVDNTVVLSDTEDGFRTYIFHELLDADKQRLDLDKCVYCEDELPHDSDIPLCLKCESRVFEEVWRLAEERAWPADAVWQHELLYITSGSSGGARIADIARRSRMTLKQVKQRLRDLVKLGCARADLDTEHGALRYAFPDIEYSRSAYQKHDHFIRRHPSSLKDELEVKIIRSLLGLIAVAVVAFVLGFFVHVPFPVLILGSMVAGIITLWTNFRRMVAVEPDRLE